MDDLYSTQERKYSYENSTYNSPYNNRSRSSDTYAEDVYSDLIRDEYRDYNERFKPVQNQYIDLATSMEMLDEQLGRISVNSKQGFDMAELNKKMSLDRYGVSQSAENQQKNKAQGDLTNALSVAQAKNSTRTHHQDRQMAMMTGANIPSIRTDISKGASSSSPIAS